MGSNIGKNCELIDTVVRVVREASRVPVWVKLTPTTTTSPRRREAAFKAGADAISSSNTFTSLPLIDPESLEFEVQRRGEGVVRRSGRTRRSCRSRSRRWRR